MFIGVRGEIWGPRGRRRSRRGRKKSQARGEPSLTLPLTLRRSRCDKDPSKYNQCSGSYIYIYNNPLTNWVTAQAYCRQETGRRRRREKEDKTPFRLKTNVFDFSVNGSIIGVIQPRPIAVTEVTLIVASSHKNPEAQRKFTWTLVSQSWLWFWGMS